MDTESLIKYVDELPDDFDELAKLIPYLKVTWKAYKFVQQKRIVLFLKAMNETSGGANSKDKEKFSKYINSNLGKELLSEYADTAIRTSSIVAIAALGILYGDMDDSRYPAGFKRLACFALQGSTDHLVEAFVTLVDLPPSSTVGPYPIHSLSQDTLESSQELERIIGNAEDAFAYVNDMIRRGLFLPDYAPSRSAGGGWFINFGCTEISHNLRDLVLKAKDILIRI